jgi:hypothetical protein
VKEPSERTQLLTNTPIASAAADKGGQLRRVRPARCDTAQLRHAAAVSEQPARLQQRAGVWLSACARVPLRETALKSPKELYGRATLTRCCGRRRRRREWLSWPEISRAPGSCTGWHNPYESFIGKKFSTDLASYESFISKKFSTDLACVCDFGQTIHISYTIPI